MKYLAALLLCSILATCATITPDQATQYAGAAQTVIGAGLQDYKTIKAVTK